MTRKMYPSEKASPMAKAAHNKEMQALLKHDMFGQCVDGDAVTNKKASFVWLAMLSFIKNIEIPDVSKHIYKGRAVLLGDKLRYVVGGNFIEPKDRWWDQLTSALTSMDESRALDSYAVLNGYQMMTVDLEAAYLQSTWPWDPNEPEKYKPEQECFVAIPEDMMG